MKKIIILCLLSLLANGVKSQITCREFDHQPVTDTREELKATKYDAEYEYSNTFANEELNEFVIRLAADSTHYIVGVGGKSVKEYNVTILDPSKNVIRTEKAKDKKNIFEYSPPKDGEYTIQIVVLCKSNNCAYIGVFGKPK